MFEKLKRKIGKSFKIIFQGEGLNIRPIWLNAFMDDIVLIIEAEAERGDFGENLGIFEMPMIKIVVSKGDIIYPFYEPTEIIEQSKALIKALKNKSIL